MKRQHPSEGTYKAYYARSPLALLGGTAPTVADLPQTHVFVRALQATDLEEVYWQMQGENWSPKGEARPLIERLGLSHTSLSLGDVVQAPDGRYHVCRWSGWEELPEGASKDETQVLRPPTSGACFGCPLYLQGWHPQEGLRWQCVQPDGICEYPQCRPPALHAVAQAQQPPLWSEPEQ